MLQQFSKLSKTSKDGKFECIDVIKCVFNLTLTDISTFESLSPVHGITTLEVAKKIGKDRSNAYRSLEKLVACGLGQRERASRETRGYSYAYTRINDQELYLKVKYNIDKCYAEIEKTLNQLKNY